MSFPSNQRPWLSHPADRASANGWHTGSPMPGDDAAVPMVPIISDQPDEHEDPFYTSAETTQAPRAERERISDALSRHEGAAAPGMRMPDPGAGPTPRPPQSVAQWEDWQDEEDDAYAPPSRATPQGAVDTIPPGPPPAGGWQPPTADEEGEHVAWHASHSWGTVSYTIVAKAQTVAGLSYLLGFFSGIPIYFSEHRNTFVRFHAMQSILLSSILAVYGCLLALVTWLLLQTQSQWVTALAVVFAVLMGLLGVGVWLYAMSAAWNGHYLPLRFIGPIAQRLSAPPRMPGR